MEMVEFQPTNTDTHVTPEIPERVNLAHTNRSMSATLTGSVVGRRVSSQWSTLQHQSSKMSGYHGDTKMMPPMKNGKTVPFVAVYEVIMHFCDS